MKNPVPPPLVLTIARIRLVVGNLRTTGDFYVEALGFAPSGEWREPGARRQRLRLGSQTIELIEFDAPGRPYPRPRSANDPWFQHFAIVVTDMDAAYARLSRHPHEPISQGGPQLLPPSTGSVTAYKFRDPDGHPLELSHIPHSAWNGVAAPSAGSPFLGIDHSAVAVADLDTSIAFYTGLGFTVAGRFLNKGPEQARLDGLAGAELDIVALSTPEAGPHIELLHYRDPPPPAVRLEFAGSDVASTRLVLRQQDGAENEAPNMQDPDGHSLLFEA